MLFMKQCHKKSRYPIRAYELESRICLQESSTETMLARPRKYLDVLLDTICLGKWPNFKNIRKYRIYSRCSEETQGPNKYSFCKCDFQLQLLRVTCKLLYACKRVIEFSLGCTETSNELTSMETTCIKVVSPKQFCIETT